MADDTNDRHPDEAKWWEEEAERHNALGDFFRKNGFTVKTPNAGKPPALNPDGSLADPHGDHETLPPDPPEPDNQPPSGGAFNPRKVR